MAYRNIEDSRAAIRRHYYANKEYYLEKNRKRRIKIKMFINELKGSTPCSDCRKSYPYYVMDFDHMRDKEFLIGKLVRSANFSGLKRELDKCEIVCANCHRIRTFERLSVS